MRRPDAVPLAPGAATGRLRRLAPGEVAGLLGDPLTDDHLAALPDGRLRLADAFDALTSPPAAVRTTPFVARVEALDAAESVLLASRGCVAVLVPRPEALSEHARHVWVALGRPVAAVAAHLGLADGERVLVEVGLSEARVSPAGPDVATPSPGSGLPVPLWPGAIPVLPVAWCGSGPTPTTFDLELVSAQAEELALAREVLRGAPVDRGVGLLRLEYVLALDPGMDALTLAERVDAWLSALASHPLAVRLTDFGPDKPRPAASPLAGAGEGRGLAGLLESGAATIQLDALAAGAGGRPLHVVAPHVESVAEFARFVEQARVLGLSPGAMLESAAALALAPALDALSDGLWLGGHDLASSLGAGWRATARQAVVGSRGVVRVCTAWAEPPGWKNY